MTKTKTARKRLTEDGANQLVRETERIAVALGLEDQIERSTAYGQIELSDTRSDHIAFGIGVTLHVRLVMEHDKRFHFHFQLGWSSCSGSPSDAIAQATLIRQLAEKAAVAQCIAREHGASWSEAEVYRAVEILREERISKEAITHNPKLDIDIADTVEKLTEAVSMIVDALPMSEAKNAAEDFVVNHLGED